MTPLERAAQAAEIAAVEKTAHHPVSAEMAKLSWLWPHIARAVLQAIREPSEAMIEAGQRRGAVLVSSMQPYQARDIFADMIDAALEEGLTAPF